MDYTPHRDGIVDTGVYHSTPPPETRLTVNDAIYYYILNQEPEYSEATIRSHKSRLGIFADFCEEYDVEYVDQIGGGLLTQYRLNRSDEINIVTLKTQLDTLRVFLRFCERIDELKKGIADLVPTPEISDEENSRDEYLSQEQASGIAENLNKYDYASRDHAVFRLLWTTGMRRGALRALDVSDFDIKERYLQLRHRPETGTPLKNKHKSERYIALDEKTCNILEDYITENRPEVADDFGRYPLIATRQGRPHGQTIQTSAYAVTRPCKYNGGTCPHDYNTESCEAARDKNKAYECPSSLSTHPLRRGRITADLREGHPTAVISDRMDVSDDVITAHYDKMTRREQMEQRRKSLGLD